VLGGGIGCDSDGPGGSSPSGGSGLVGVAGGTGWKGAGRRWPNPSVPPGVTWCPCVRWAKSRADRRRAASIPSEPEPKQPLPLPLGGDLHQLDSLHGAVLGVPGILPERIERLAGFLQGGEFTHGHLAPGIVGVEAEGHRPGTTDTLGSFCRTALQPTKKPLPKQGMGRRQA
jgi:hypothetical protein